MAQTEAPGFTAFVDAELPRLLGYGHVLTGNEHDAWDLTPLLGGCRDVAGGRPGGSDAATTDGRGAAVRRDLDLAGIAAEMHCSLGTAKSHLSRGLRRLRDCATGATIVEKSTEGV
jgi:hypothetical protein